MPIYIEDHATETRLDALARHRSRPVKSNKKAMARAILDKVSKLPPPAFNAWIDSPDVTPPPATN